MYECEWEGTIGALKEHVVKCEFSLVPCPKECKDNKDEITHFMRKDLGRHMESNCPNRDHECEYCGEKGTYAYITQVHDNTCEKKIITCPNAGCTRTIQRKTAKRHYNRCVYTEIPCPKECKDMNGISHFMRKDLGKHLRNFCPNRKINCEHCGEKGTYAYITQVHDSTCEKKIVPCPNSPCAETIQFMNVKRHIEECAYTRLPCKYQRLGCEVNLMRKDIPSHENEDKLHLHMALDKVITLEAILQQHFKDDYI